MMPAEIIELNICLLEILLNKEKDGLIASGSIFLFVEKIYYCLQ